MKTKYLYLVLFIAHIVITGCQTSDNEGISDVDRLIEMADSARLTAKDSIIIYADSALSLAMDYEYNEGIIKGYYRMAVGYYFANQLDTTIYWAEKAINYNPEHIDTTILYDEKGKVHNLLGIINKTTKGSEGYEKAIEHYLASIKYAEKLGISEPLANTYHNIVDVFRLTKDYDKALEYNLKAEQLYKELNKLNHIPVVLTSRGNIQYSMGDTLKALNTYKEALRVEKNSLENQVSLLQNIGAAYLELNVQDSAILYFEKALPIYEQFGDIKGIWGRANTYNNIGLYYMDKGIFSEAIRYSEKGLALAKQYGFLDLIETSNSNIAQTYDKWGKYKEALSFYKSYSNARDSLYSADVAKAVQDAEGKYQAKKKEYENELLRKDNILKTTALKAANVRNALIGIVLLFTLVILYLVYQSRKQYKEQNKKLETANNIINQQYNELLLNNQQLQEINNAEIAKNETLVQQTEQLIAANEQAIAEKKHLVTDISALEEEQERLKQEKIKLDAHLQEMKAKGDELMQEQQKIELQQAELAKENEALKKQVLLLMPVDRDINVGKRTLAWSSDITHIVKGDANKRNYCLFYSRDNDIGERQITFQNLLKELPQHFVQIHKSSIVNVTHVSYEKGSDWVRIKGMNKSLSVTKKDELWDKYSKHRGSEV